MSAPTRAEVFARRSRLRPSLLTPRQDQCLTALHRLLRSRVIRPRERVGCIADALDLNETTVRVHLAKARAKGRT